eukprot:scaffold27814_cov77-Phaeocystis_antarctica.AAC.1
MHDADWIHTQWWLVCPIVSVWLSVTPSSAWSGGCRPRTSPDSKFEKVNTLQCEGGMGEGQPCVSQARAVASVLSPIEGGILLAGPCGLTSKLGKEKAGRGMQF